MKSLKGRLLLASLLVMPLALGSTGYALDHAFRASLASAEKVRLERYFYLLFSIAELPFNSDIQTLSFPDATAEPDFENTSSGVIGLVYNRTGDLLWQSNSAKLLPALPPHQRFGTDFVPGQLVFDEAGENDGYFFARFDTLWQMPSGEDLPFRFALLHSRAEYNQSLATFREQLWRGLGGLALLLLTLQTLLLAWALQPLGRLALALGRMRDDSQTSVSGDFPTEIQQVTDSLNQVLAREAALRTRYRESLSNLAHSLKTPLAVLQSITAKAPAGSYREQSLDQLERINQVVNYQLQRAVTEQQNGSQLRTPLATCVERLGRSLGKIYSDKGVRFTQDIAADLSFRGDEQDLLEIMGNLLDNAFKYGETQVCVSAGLQTGVLCIQVDDDGPGIDENMRNKPFARGQRLDTSKPGQGIGLAVCADITASYKGNLQIGRSVLGGARFTLTLPGTRST